MLTGIVNQSSLPQLLQSIAQRRKQGQLEITLPDLIFRIYFYQGKIVEVQEGDRDPAADTGLLLANAGKCEAPPAAPSYQNLLECLKQDSKALSDADARTVLRAAVRKRVLSKLHTFRIEGTVPWGFKVGGVPIDRDLAAGISVGQLLLDWAELEEIAPRWSAALPSADTAVQRSDGAAADGDAGLILHAAQSPLTIDRLQALLLIDELTFKRSVLQLIETSRLQVSSAAVPVQPAVQATVEVPPAVTAADTTPEETPPAGRNRREKKPRKPAAKGGEATPHIVALLILVLALALPFLFWGRAWMLF